MADNIYQPDTSAPAPVAAPVAASIPGGASDSPFSFGGDPNAPGMLGMSRGFWRDIANLGANMTTAANARTSGGFLANGTGFMGPFGAAVGETMQQGVKNAATQSELNARNAQTLGEGLKNAGLQAGLPLLQFQSQQTLDFLQHPEHAAAYAAKQAAAYNTAFPTGASNTGTSTTTGDTGGGAGTAAPATPYSRSIAGMEGVNRQNPEGSPISNAASSARGTGQFVDGTWLGFFHANPNLFPAGTTEQQALAMRDDPQAGPVLGHAAINWLGTQNAAALQKSGVDATGQSLGIAHWLGSTATAAVMKAPDDAAVKDVLYESLPTKTADAYMKANPQLAGYTVGALKTRYANIPTPPFGTQTATKNVQVAQAGAGAVPVPGQTSAPTQATQNADAIVAGQRQAQGAATPGTQTTAEAGQPPSYTAQQGYAKAQSYLGEAARNEQILASWEQRKAFNVSKGIPFFEPRPMVRDPAMLRTMAQQENQAALDVDQAGPKQRAIAMNSNVEARPDGLIRVPLASGGYEWVRGPHMENRENSDGSTTVGYMTPPSPDAPPGTQGVFTPAKNQDGSDVIVKIPTALKDAYDTAFKDYQEKSTKSYIGAQGMLAQTAQLDNAAEEMNQSSVTGIGPTADLRMHVLGVANDIGRVLGLGQIADPNAVAAWEEMRKASSALGFQFVRENEGASRQAAQTIMQGMQTVPHATNSPVGYHLVQAGVQAVAQTSVDLHDYKTKVIRDIAEGKRPYSDLLTADSDFFQKNTPELYTKRATSAVEPLKINTEADTKKYLPGTWVIYKNRVWQVSNRAGSPSIPGYMRTAPPAAGTP